MKKLSTELLGGRGVRSGQILSTELLGGRVGRVILLIAPLDGGN